MTLKITSKKKVLFRCSHVCDLFRTINEPLYADRSDFIATIASSVLEETDGVELLHSGNQVASAVIEKCLSMARPDQFERFMNIFGEHLRAVFHDEFSSHVLEKLLVELSHIVMVCIFQR